MARISSTATFYWKRVFPSMWFGLLTLVLIFAVGQLFSAGDWVFALTTGLAAAIFAGFGWALMQVRVFDLVDEVWDAGDALLVKDGRHEVRILLADVAFVDRGLSGAPRRVTLILRRASPLGAEIAFIPVQSFSPFRLHPAVCGVIERIEATRRPVQALP